MDADTSPITGADQRAWIKKLVRSFKFIGNFGCAELVYFDILPEQGGKNM